METERIERVEHAFMRRYRIKKLVNLLISAVVVVLGITSVVFIWMHDKEGLLTFRWMTVDGTVFTTAIALFYVVVSAHEMLRYTELTSVFVYYTRLASAVAESLILIIVLLSQLPIFPQHMHVFRYDMFNMHLLIPLLTVLSFSLNDSPIGKLRFRQKLHGMWFVALYAVTVLTLIQALVIPASRIPYFFMDIASMDLWEFMGCFLFIFALSFLLTHCLSTWNRKLSWVWFRDVAGNCP